MYPLTARAFLDWGQKISKQDIKPGDIVVFPRGNQGWQGHVGFYLKTQTINGVEYYLILGGNQRNKVSIVPYRASRALGIRRNLLDV
jgi:cell wall-associated NlpC family hydrolase